LFSFYVAALLIQKEVELADLKSKVAEVMAFMPSPPSTFSSPSLAMRYSPSLVNSAISQGNGYPPSIGAINHIGGVSNHIGLSGLGANQQLMDCVGNGMLSSKSSLNPSASDYTPKISQ